MSFQGLCRLVLRAGSELLTSLANKPEAQAKGVRKYISLQCPPHELFPWEYTMKRKPPPGPRHRSWMPEELFSAALCVAAGLSCNGDSLARFTYATSMDVTSP